MGGLKIRAPQDFDHNTKEIAKHYYFEKMWENETQLDKSLRNKIK